MIRVLIIDDHPMVIEGIRALVSLTSAFELAGSATDAYSALRWLEAHTADLALTDINLPDMDGIALCAEIRRLYPRMKVLGLSTFKERSYITRMIQAGASGYLLKNASAEELEDALTTVMRGKMYLSHEATEMITSLSPTPAAPVLTAREKEVLKMIADGMTNQEIATTLFISPLTVDSHRKNLLAKMGVKNTAALIRAGMEWGMI